MASSFRSTVTILLATAGLLSACSSPPQRTNAQRQTEVGARERAFAATMANRDLHAFSEFIADDAVFFSGAVNRACSPRGRVTSDCYRAVLMAAGYSRSARFGRPCANQRAGARSCGKNGCPLSLNLALRRGWKLAGCIRSRRRYLSVQQVVNTPAQ